MYYEFHTYTKLFEKIPFKPRKYNILIKPKIYNYSKSTKLEVSQNKKIDLIKTLKTRETKRNFKKKTMDLEILSDVIYYSIFNEKSRAYPSAGARYPIELYLAVFNVKNMKKGIYYINQKTKMIFLLKEGDYQDDIFKISQNQFFTKNASFAIIMTANFERTIEKYGERGYRYVLIDAGHIGQNFCLISEGLKIGCVPVGGFYDNLANKLLNLSDSEQTIYMMFFGGV